MNADITAIILTTIICTAVVLLAWINKGGDKK